MWRILSLLPDGLLEWAALTLVAGMTFLAGYGRGADDTRQECETRIAVLQKEYAEREQARAEAMAAAEKSARERLAAATARGDRLALEVAQRTKELDAERASVTRRLAHAAEAARRDCAGLSAEWVRLYNETLGLAGPGAGDSAEGGSPASGIAAGPAGASGAAGAGIRPDALATPEDVLTHIRDYGHYCRTLEAGYRSLILFTKEDTP